MRQISMDSRLYATFLQHRDELILSWALTAILSKRLFRDPHVCHYRYVRGGGTMSRFKFSYTEDKNGRGKTNKENDRMITDRNDTVDARYSPEQF